MERSMKTRVGSIVLLAAALVLGPALSSSEATGRLPAPRDVVLYELNEQAQFTATSRVATSGLEGKARRGTPLCPEGLMAYAEAFFASLPTPMAVTDANRCTVVAFGTSDLDLKTFQGTIGGDFYVVVNTDKTNLVDASELVIMTGTFKGIIQVADREGVVIDILAGSFNPKEILPGFPGGLPSAATFTGKFRLPFTVRHVAVYKMDGGGVVPVGLDERSLGDPTVRVEIRFDRGE
jgi:hypothetical protein